MKQVYKKTRKEWRNWLSRNHDKCDGIWLVFYKKGTGQPTLAYEDAVEEALCFGWIDSIIKKLDEEKYTRKLTPRRKGSQWSDANKRRIEKLSKQGLMADPGLAKVQEAKKSGSWNQPGRPVEPVEPPEEWVRALARNRKVKKLFEQLSPSCRKQYLGWIAAAKRPETRERRVCESIKMIERGETLGMK